MKKFVIILSVAIIAFLGSCTRESQIVQPQIQGAQPTNPRSAARVATFPLDWEGVHKDFMPAPPGFLIKTPWASGGTGAQVNIDKSVLNDRKSSEGWVLLYNTFNTQALPSVLYFMLYNKYRGLVRLYYYTCSCNGTGNISSREILHGLQTSGANAPRSPLLNYAAQSIVDVNVNSTSFNMTDNKAITPNAWYVFQYEVAYDRNISTYNFTNFDFNWAAKGLQTTEVKLNGKATGSIDGKIAVKGGGIDLSGTALAIATKGTVVLNGGEAAEGILDKLGIKDGIKKGISDGVSGIVSNVLSGIFGIGNEDNTHLKVDLDLELKGTLSSSFLVTPLRFATPGYDQSNTAGFEPFYNQPMGVFYLAQNPVINVEMVREFLDPRDRSTLQVTRTYTLAPIQYIFNPAVTSIANIVVKKQEIIMSSGAIGGTTEVINGRTYVVGNNLRTVNNAPPILGVRVALDIIPKDGSPRVTIVKTFASRRF